MPSPTMTNPIFSGSEPSDNGGLARSAKIVIRVLVAFVRHCASLSGDLPSPRATQKEERRDSSAYDYSRSADVSSGKGTLGTGGDS